MKLFDTNIDFEVIKTSKSFKEDSVREEIIAPILNKLGYSAFSENRIIRSKPLIHPYVQFGTRKEHIYIIPDYLLQVNNKYRFVLDAKAPTENILRGKNPEQAFSYAIHKEIRVEKYALCNGIEFVVFDINEITPLLHLKVKDIEKRWNDLAKILSPIAFTNPYIFDYKPDFGVRFIKSGGRSDMKLNFIDSGIGPVSRVNDDIYTFTLTVLYGEECLASFDFQKSMLNDFIKQVPYEKQNIVYNCLTHYPFKYEIKTEEDSFRISLSATLGNNVVHNENEVFIPLIVVKFI